MRERESGANPAPDARDDPNAADYEMDTVPTTAADVASAGRSCMVIVILAVIIILLVCVWLAYRSVGGGA